MNTSDIPVLAVIGFLLFLAIYSIVHNMKRKDCGCGCTSGCSCCSGHNRRIKNQQK